MAEDPGNVAVVPDSGWPDEKAAKDGAELGFGMMFLPVAFLNVDNQTVSGRVSVRPFWFLW